MLSTPDAILKSGLAGNFGVGRRKEEGEGATWNELAALLGLCESSASEALSSWDN